MVNFILVNLTFSKRLMKRSCNVKWVGCNMLTHNDKVTRRAGLREKSCQVKIMFKRN